MDNLDFFQALEQLEREMKIERTTLISYLESGLATAFKRETGESRAVSVTLNPEKSTIRFYAYQHVVEGEPEEDSELSLEEAQEIKPDAKVGDYIGEDVTPDKLSRIAAQAAKQILFQKINEAKRELAKTEMSDREGELAQAVVRRVDVTAVYVEIVGTQLEGVMPLSEQMPGERYRVNDKIKVYVKKVRETNKGAQVVVSRNCAGYVRRIFDIEVPELRSGLVKVKNIVREAGYRTKMSVYTEDPNLDPIGACIGAKGSRVNAIVQELMGEKVDIILYSQEPSDYIARALSPAKVLLVQLNETDKIAKVVVPDEKLSLAIGKSGQNARLAAKLTGYKIDVKPYSEVISDTAYYPENEEESEEETMEESFETLEVENEEVVEAVENIEDLADTQNDNGEENI